jgi:acyl-CoA synthetase (AMP-forming)/AMP-acid ligase II
MAPETTWQWDVENALARFSTGPRRRQLAVIDTAEAISFVEIHARARRIASTLADRPDAHASDIVPLEARSRVSFMTAVLGVMLAGKTPLPVSGRALHPIREYLTQVGNHTPAKSCRPWAATLSDHSGRRSVWVTHGETPTVPRKALALGMQPGGVAMLSSPLNLAGPFEYALRQLLLGGCIVLSAPFDPATWIRMACTWRPTWSFLVPSQLRRLLDETGEPELRDAMASLRTVLHSSETCPNDLRHRVLRSIGDGRVMEYYGTVQYEGICTRTSPQEPCSGPPIQGAELRVVDDQGRPLPPGLGGHLEGRSAVGLVSHPLESHCPEPSSWRGVGDGGCLTKDGQFELTSVSVPGRAIVGGVKVSLDHVREVLERHPAVMTCDADAVLDSQYGQVIRVHIVSRDPTLTRQELMGYSTAHLDSPERPRRISLILASRPHAREVPA